MSKLKKLLDTSILPMVVPGGTAFRFDPPGAREAVLLIHGFGGSPHNLAPTGQVLADAGYAVFAPRLPGHASCRADLLASGAEDWLRCAIDAYMELQTLYGTVHVVGHSMGGLLAGLVATRFGAPSLALFAPAFVVNNKMIKYTPLIAPFRPIAYRYRPVPADITDPVRIALHPEYWSDDLLVSAAELQHLQNAAKRLLPAYEGRIFLVLGDADTTIPLSVENYLRKRARSAASFDSLIVKGRHSFPLDPVAGIVASNALLEWLQAAPR